MCIRDRTCCWCCCARRGWRPWIGKKKVPTSLVGPGGRRAHRSGMTVAIDVLKGHARHVMRVLGPGHRERIYHNALITALNRRAIPHRSEVACPIWFMGECIGMGRADLVIEDLIVDIKANRLPPVSYTHLTLPTKRIV